MSLYNLLFGIDKRAPILLAILGIDQKVKNEPSEPEWDDYEVEDSPEVRQYIQTCVKRKIWKSGRFRDIYLNKEGDKIILLTRNGGANRRFYWYVFEILAHHPNYLCDYDDEFDKTYAYVEFSVPKEAKELCKALAAGKEPKTLAEKFSETMAELKKMKPEDIRKDKRFKPLIDIFKKIANDSQKK